MNILFIEPYYEGSHKHFTNSLIATSKHNFTLWHMKGRHWKWRMQSSAIYFADKFNKTNKNFDLILVSDMFNLPLFISLIRKRAYNNKFIIYFHENQFAYPEDANIPKDMNYPFINYISALSADACLFNSEYNLSTFLDGASKLLRIMPDKRNMNTVKEISKKSHVMPLGFDFSTKQFKKANINDKCNILWNHRWEYDKNPKIFFDTLIKLKALPFNIYITGKSNTKYPKIFDIANKQLKEKIKFFGKTDTYKEYIDILKKCDMLPVTSNHDFFGISIMEAIHYDTFPLLPKKLSYVELYKPNENPEIFYDDEKDFLKKLKYSILNFKKLKNFSHLTQKYSFDEISKKYDKFFDSQIVK